MPVKHEREKMEVFCGFSTGKAPVKNPLAGANIRLSCLLRQNLDG
jgi:hypothetical protein